MRRIFYILIRRITLRVTGMKYDLNDLYYFVKVVEYGGFSPAGEALGIPKSRSAAALLTSSRS